MSAREDSPQISRRHFLQITAVASTVFLGGRWIQRLAQKNTTIHQTRLLMGTLINLILVTDDAEQGQQAIDATFAEMERLIALFNWRQPDSPLAILNRSSRLAQPPAELVELLQEANRCSRLSGGAFDVTILPLLQAVQSRADTAQPRQLVDYRRLHVTADEIRLEPGMQVTLDSIAKGRVVDGATAVLQTHGYDNVLVEAGGDLLAQGSRADGRPWRLVVTHPRQTDSALNILQLTNQAAATSGDYQHSFSQDFSSHHIVDPRTGASPGELASVTVLAPTAAAADALSTAVMVLGSKAGLAFIEQLPDVATLMVTKEMNVIHSVNFPAVS
ncbi:MAG: FAD:protein FMN transferase [Anaerolineaceae bacterium]|nr:FAD:protein FMN transferase [Anaerolineaceae bacterium]